MYCEKDDMTHVDEHGGRHVGEEMIAAASPTLSLPQNTISNLQSPLHLHSHAKRMEETPLASLSLTHVHYVCSILSSHHHQGCH